MGCRKHTLEVPTWFEFIPNPCCWLDDPVANGLDATFSITMALGCEAWHFREDITLPDSSSSTKHSKVLSILRN